MGYGSEEKHDSDAAHPLSRSRTRSVTSAGPVRGTVPPRKRKSKIRKPQKLKGFDSLPMSPKQEEDLSGAIQRLYNQRDSVASYESPRTSRGDYSEELEI